MPTPSAEISNYAHLTHSFCFKCVEYDPELGVPLNLERSRKDSCATPGQHATFGNKIFETQETKSRGPGKESRGVGGKTPKGPLRSAIFVDFDKILRDCGGIWGNPIPWRGIGGDMVDWD